MFSDIIACDFPFLSGMTKLRTGIYKNCLFCHKEYYVKKYLIPTSKYCSRSCGAKFVRVQIKRNCDICHNEFEHISSRSNKAKYCSHACYNVAQRNKGKTIFTCQHCHKEFIGHACHNRKYCSKKCVQKESHLTFVPSFTTVRKAMLTRSLINSCNRCGYNSEPRILGVHHKDRDRNNNELSNLEVLCPNCHSLEHLKHISHGFRE
jgi:hypothetical protein